MPTPVTDPALISQLEGAGSGRPVTDPGLIAELESGRPSGSQQALTGFSNQGVAAGQLTTPDTAAHAKNFLGVATVDEEGNLLYKDQSGNLVPTDRNKHVALTDPSDNQMKVYARTPETDEGRASATGRLLMMGMGAGAPTARPGLAVPSAAKIQPKASDIFSTAKPYYRAFEQEASKIEVPPQTTAITPGGKEVSAGLGDRVRGALAKANFIEELAKPIYSATEILDKDEPMTLEALQNVKRVIGRGFNSPDKNVRDAAGVASKEIMKIMTEVAPGAAQNLKTADEIHQTALALQDLQRKEAIASLRKGKAGYGGNAVNTMRQVISPIVEASIKGRKTLFKPDEIAAMNDIVEGTTATNTARGIGQLSPAKGIQSTAISLGGSAVFGLPAVAIPALGIASNKLAAILTGRQIERLKDLVAKRSPAYSEAVAKATQRYEKAQADFASDPSPARLNAYVSASRALSAGLSRDGIPKTAGDLIRAIQGPMHSPAEGEQPEAEGVLNQ